jgi:hypothetical protein
MLRLRGRVSEAAPEGDTVRASDPIRRLFALFGRKAPGHPGANAPVRGQKHADLVAGKDCGACDEPNVIGVRCWVIFRARRTARVSQAGADATGWTRNVKCLQRYNGFLCISTAPRA